MVSRSDPSPGAHPVVSSDAEELILVDADDNEIGTLSKALAHDGDGVLHRAFSLFLFTSDGRLLLQQRGADKRLWPLVWANTCCSHPRRGETMEVATRRRLAEELGLSAELEFLFTFTYHARYLDRGSERELCHVFAGITDAEPTVNANEIAAIRYASAADLDRWIAERPDELTPWLHLEWPRVRSWLAERGLADG